MVATRTHPNPKRLIPLLVAMVLITACGSERTDEQPDSLVDSTVSETIAPTHSTVGIGTDSTPQPNTLGTPSNPNEFFPTEPPSPTAKIPTPNVSLYDDGQ